MSRQVSKQLFCPHCGRPAVKWIPSRMGNSAWKPEWRNSCGHVGGPQRMGAARAALLAANFIAMRNGRIARARAALKRGRP